MNGTSLNILRCLPARRIVLIPLLVLLAAGLVAGCSDDPTPTATATVAPEPTATATAPPTPTATAAPATTATATAISTPTVTATATPEPTVAPEPTATPVLETREAALDRYVSLCTYLDATSARDFDTYGEFSAHLEEVIEEAHAFPAPAELLEWHQAVHDFLDSMQKLVSSQPADDPIDPFILAPVLPSVANLQEAALLLDPELRESMAEIGCLASPASPS